MKTFKDYSFLLPGIKIAELKLKFVMTDDKRDVEVFISNSDINGTYIKEWKKTAAGNFLVKDFKNDNRDFIGNTLYHELEFFDIVTRENFKVILRLLNEITYITLSEEEKEELIKQYGEIKIDNRYFSVIKIYPNDGVHNLESNDLNKFLETEKLSKLESIDFSSIIDNTNISSEDVDDKDEQTNQDPLF